MKARLAIPAALLVVVAADAATRSAQVAAAFRGLTVLAASLAVWVGLFLIGLAVLAWHSYLLALALGKVSRWGASRRERCAARQAGVRAASAPEPAVAGSRACDF